MLAENVGYLDSTTRAIYERAELGLNGSFIKITPSSPFGARVNQAAAEILRDKGFNARYLETDLAHGFVYVPGLKFSQIFDWQYLQFADPTQRADLPLYMMIAYLPRCARQHIPDSLDLYRIPQNIHGYWLRPLV